MQSKTRIIVAVSVVAAVGLATLGFRGPAAKSQEVEKPKAVAVQTSILKESQAPEIQSFAGTVHARLNSTLSARIAGRVLSVSVREGDEVKAGELLVVLDDSAQAASAAAAHAGLSSAASDLKASRLTAEMQGQADQARIQGAQAAVVSASAAVSNAKAKLDLVLAGPRPEEREQARQQVASSSAQLSLAQADMGRYQTLYDEGAISRQQYDQANEGLRTAEANYETAVQAKVSTDAADGGSRYGGVVGNLVRSDFPRPGDFADRRRSRFDSDFTICRAGALLHA